TLYSVVYATLLDSLPFEDGDELVVLWTENQTEGQDRYFVSPQDFGDWRELNTTFQGMAAHWPTPVAITELDGGPTRASAVWTTEDFFDVVGGAALRGRVFTPGDGPGSQQVAVLSQALWETRFGADPGIIGRTLVVDGEAVEVVGVVRGEHTFPEGTDLWMNMTWPMSIQSRYARWMSAVGRLGNEVPIERAAEDMDRIALRLGEIHPADAGWEIGMASLREDLVGDTGRALWILLGATGLILLIACANVANLLLSRSEARGLEVAVRSAFGASRGRIARQLLSESLLLAGAGAAAGVAGAWASLKLLPSLAPGVLPFTAEASLEPSVLLVSVVVTVVTGLLFGLAPLVKILRGRMFSPLKEGTRGTRGAQRVRLQSTFVIGQLALATILTVGAGLLAKSFTGLRSVDMGFQPGGVLTFEVDLSPTMAEEDTDVAQTYEAILGRLAALPGVESVGGTSELPLTQTLDYSQPFVIEDRLSVDAEETRAFFRHITPEFFSALRTPVLEGRGLEPFDRLDVPGVVVVNETLADRYWPDESPLGKRISGTSYRWGPLGAVLVSEAEVVGVVKDIRYDGVREDAQPALYFNYHQAPIRRMALTVRSLGDPNALVSSVRQAVANVNQDLPVSNLKAMQDVVSSSLARDRFSTLLLSLFGFVALALAAVGVYGVLAYSVEQRVREVGIRMALGASKEKVRAMVMRDGAIVVGIGLGLGLLGALALAGVISSQLFGVSPRDPLVLVSVLVTLALVGALASGIPAHRATRVNPLEAMRSD
ncbi:MAG: ABC transporter permease, partial [Gemmatimonadetes bacterium]|nr:ABC transporter permease [Gemmatimonadota bacterium]